MAKFDLVTKIILDAGGFTTGIDSAKRSTKEFQGLISDFTGGLARFLTPFAAVGTVGEAVKSTIESTAGSAEKFEVQIEGLKGAFDGFFRTVATGDWSNLIKNIDNAKTATKELKEQQIELGHIVAGDSIKKAELSFQLAEAKNKAAEETDKRLKAQYLQEAIDLQKQLTDLNVSEYAKSIGITQDYYKKLSNMDENWFNALMKEVPTIAKNYESYYSQLEGWMARKEQLENKDLTLGTWSRDADNNAIKIKSGLTEAEQKELVQLNGLILRLQDYKVLQDDLSKKGKWDEFIKEIGAMVQAGAEGESALRRMLKQLSTIKDELNKPVKEDIKFAAGSGGIYKSPKPIDTTKLHWDNGNNTHQKLAEIKQENDAIDKQNKLLQDQQQTIANGLIGAFTDLFSHISEGFAGMSKAFVQMIEKMAEEMLARAAAFAVLNLISGGGFSAAQSGGFLKFILPHFASGGVSGGGWSVVGENGPELVALPSGGRVYNNKETNKIFSGDGKQQVEFVIKGNNLVGVLSNNSRSRNSYR